MGIIKRRAAEWSRIVPWKSYPFGVPRVHPMHNKDFMRVKKIETDIGVSWNELN